MCRSYYGKLLMWHDESHRQNCVRENRMQGFTLIELLVVIAIISLLVSILLPSLAKAKEFAREIMCMSNLHSNGIAMHTYSQEYDGLIPMQAYRSSDAVLVRWSQFLDGGTYLGNKYEVPGVYVESFGVFLCPTAEPAKYSTPDYTYGGNFSPYSNSGIRPAIKTPEGYNSGLTSILDVSKLTSRYWLLVDSHNISSGKQVYGALEDPLRWGGIGGAHLRHKGSTANTLLGDGHVEKLDQGGLYQVGFRSGFDQEQGNLCFQFVQ